MEECVPINFYNFFFDENVLDFLISETNRYAHKTLDQRTISRCSR
jgi:hypothetical protein